MKLCRRSIVSVLVLLVCMPQMFAATPYFNARSQSAHVPLEMVGQSAYINRYQPNGNYTVLSFSTAFSQTFRKKDIACCLFGPDLVNSGDCAQLTISGSGRSDRNTATDWLADYFGLATDFKSTVQFSPRVRNVMIDGNFYFGLDEWWHEGMYFKMHAPFVHTRWELGFCEKVCDKGTADYSIGYFNSNFDKTASPNTEVGVTRSNLLNSFEEFAVQCKAPNVNPTIDLAPSPNTDPILTPVVFKPLANARMAGCDCSPLTRNGLADLRFTLGYNPYMNETYHVGFGLTGAAPTGNRPHGEFVFEPMVGNGNHWELGGEITAHYQFWQSEDGEESVTGYFDANLTHMFTTRQTRTFDLKGKPNSRYMLAQKMGEPVYQLIFRTHLTENQELVTGVPSQFKDVFMPVANLTTVDVNVNVGAQVDLALMLNYTTNNVSFDVGYNLWARSCERIKLNCKCPNKLTDGQTWALKGDAHVYGFSAVTLSGDTPSGNIFAVPLSATQSNATIHQGANVVKATSSVNVNQNPGVDSQQYAQFVRIQSDLTAPATLALYDHLVNVPNPRGNIFTSKDPVFITECDLDLDAAATKGLSHTVFGNLSYQWLHKEGYVPFLGIGFSAEFADTTADCCKSTSSNKDCSKDCGTGCDRCGLSQWTVWVKGGFSFD